MLDHNYNLWGRAIDELSDPAAYEYIDGIAWHGYVGEPTAMIARPRCVSAEECLLDRRRPGHSTPDYQTDYATWADTFNDILNNWARSITAWNLALDEKGKPNVGPFSCGGVITIESANHKVTRSGQYWAFAHYSKHVQRGAKVFATDGIGDDERGRCRYRTPAFRNPDGSFVVVVANRGEERRVQLVLGSKALEVELPADSVQTLQWA